MIQDYYSKFYLTELKDYLSAETDKGMLYVAYSPADGNLRKSMQTFSSSWDVQQHCLDKSDENGFHTYRPIRELQKDVDEALQRENFRQILKDAPIVENVYENRQGDVLDNLLKNDIAEVHVRQEARLSDIVDKYEVIGNRHTGMIYEEGYENYRISSHKSYDEARTAFVKAFTGDTEMPHWNQLNYHLIATHSGVWPQLDPDGIPQQGTATLLRSAFQTENLENNTRNYKIEKWNDVDATVLVNVPKLLTIDIEKGSFQLQDKTNAPLLEKDFSVKAPQNETGLSL